MNRQYITIQWLLNEFSRNFKLTNFPKTCRCSVLFGVGPPAFLRSALPSSPGSQSKAQQNKQEVGSNQRSVLATCSCLAYSLVLKMEAIRSSKTLVDLYQITRWYNPEDFIFKKLFHVRLLDIAMSHVSIYLGMLEVEGTDETATLRKSVQLVTLLTCVQGVPD
jgi:hypothetical protein